MLYRVSCWDDSYIVNGKDCTRKRSFVGSRKCPVIFLCGLRKPVAEPRYSPELDCTKGRPLPRSCSSAVTRHKSVW